MVKRQLDLDKALGQRNSAFLLGARGVGKTRLSQAYVSRLPDVAAYDLLRFDVFNRYLKDPSLFRREIEDLAEKKEGLLVWIDEVQKIPPLLDEVHSLLESHPKGKLRFLLTGSSARRLKRAGANLLAGRALSLRLHPLTREEAGLPLEKALRLGSLPGIVIDQDAPELALKSYVATYLKEEIFNEALVRRVDAFSRFLEVAAQFHGESINAREIGKAAGVSGQTVQEYFQILEDTLIAWKLPGWSASVKKQLRTTPKFYLFDNGVANALRGELEVELRPSSTRYGKLFECWIIQESFRLNDYRGFDFKLSYWRTNSGLEVDLVASRGAGPPLAAFEIKSSTVPENKHLHGLAAFATEYPEAKLFCVCRTPKAYRMDGVRVIPWERLAEILANL